LKITNKMMNLEHQGMGTVIDREVALAAAAQGMAPAGAMPPIMVGMLTRRDVPQSFMTVGAPVRSGGPIRKELPPTPKSDAFSNAEMARRMKVGGFVGAQRMPNATERFDFMQIAAIPSGPANYLGQDNGGGYAHVGPQIPLDLVALMERDKVAVVGRSVEQQPILRPEHARVAAPKVAPGEAPRIETAAGSRAKPVRGTQ